ncbi:hypothetical protein [Aquimarina sp. AU474]|uniref:hypothetical protein n=1 Tax=Aquimarina sp. AU474 TaxID=2108529 RepID=UPI000D69C7D5|nr:hypothetical protein [Aquimarina sp. AU474]
MKTSTYTKILLLLFVFNLTLSSCSGDDSTPEEEPISNPDPNGNIQCTDGKTFVFLEKNGLLTIEAEKSKFENTSWKQLQSIGEYTGDGYLVWEGDNFLNKPGNGVLTYTIKIATPGTYRFIWRSYITIGSNSSEHNDSWLRIPDASHFYGQKNNGHIVYPKGTNLPPIPESAGQTSTEPAGGGKDGWFKIYMNKANQWHWQSSTSDNDGHNIYAIFDTAGDYTIEISGRSKGHGIDKFVLFNENTSQNDATTNNTSISEIVCQ